MYRVLVAPPLKRLFKGPPPSFPDFRLLSLPFQKKRLIFIREKFSSQSATAQFSKVVFLKSMSNTPRSGRRYSLYISRHFQIY